MFGFRWLKNSKDAPDAMLTFATASFVLTSLCIVLSMIESISIPGAADIKLTAPSETLVLGYLGAAFTSYVFRRNKKDQIQFDETKIEIENKILGE